MMSYLRQTLLRFGFQEGARVLKELSQNEEEAFYKSFCPERRQLYGYFL